ncbi:MAG: DNA adenine methylase [Candidatus Sericytochromatia bacterium]
MAEKKSYIETFFPTDLLNAQVTREKGGNAFKGVHRWYSRKPLSFSRASVLGAILPDTVTEVEFLQLLGMKEHEAKLYWNDKKTFMQNHKNSTRLFDQTPTQETKKKIREYIKRHWGKENLTVLDPFAGGGSIPFEALRLGMDVIANDLNPVAVTTMKAAIEFPFTFGEELQKDIDYYVNWIGEEAKKRLAEFFPAPEGQEVQNYLWAHTVPCEYCETVVPLSPNWMLYNRPEKQNLIKWCAIKPIPNPENKTVDFELIRGKAGSGKNIVQENGEIFEPEKYNTIARGVGNCPNCSRLITEEYLKGYATTKGLGHRMYAVAYRDKSNKEGLTFRLPTEMEINQDLQELIKQKLDEKSFLIPNEDILFGDKTNEMLNRGIKKWSDMFNPRQLLTLITYLELIHETIQDMDNKDFENDKKEAIVTYLDLVLNRCVDKNSRLSMWHSGRISIEKATATHSLNLMWNYPELVPYILWTSCADVVTEYIQLVKWLDSNKNLSSISENSCNSCLNSSIKILQESASSLYEIGSNSVDIIVTDPPYYDTIQYAELSDFFYVWQKRALEPLYLPRLQNELTNKEDEAVANSSRFRNEPKPKESAKKDYEEKMRMAFAECHRVLQDQGVMIVQFNHKDSGAWDALSQALMEAGFTITATWSVNTESPENLHQANKNSVASTVALSCRKRLNTEEGWWSEVEGKVREKVEEKATTLEDWGMEGIDLLLGCFGPALEVLSEQYPVLHQDGTQVRPEEIFQVTRKTLIKHLFKKYTDSNDLLLDKEMQFYSVIWSLLQAQSFDFDEARQIALAVGIEVKELENRKILKKDKGDLTFLSPDERLKKRAFDIEGDYFLSQVDILHALFCTTDAGGSNGVNALAKRMNWLEDKAVLQVLEVAYQVLPQTDKYPMRKQLEDIVTWVDSWAKFFRDNGIWDKKQVEKEKEQMGLFE